MFHLTPRSTSDAGTTAGRRSAPRSPLRTRVARALVVAVLAGSSCSTAASELARPDEPEGVVAGLPFDDSEEQPDFGSPTEPSLTTATGPETTGITAPSRATSSPLTAEDQTVTEPPSADRPPTTTTGPTAGVTDPTLPGTVPATATTQPATAQPTNATTATTAATTTVATTPTTATTATTATTVTTATTPSGAAADVRPVSYWEGKFDTAAVRAQCDQRIVDLQGARYGSHALYRSAYTCFDGLVAMWRATGDTAYLDIALDHIERAIGLARSRTGQYDDDFLGWEAFDTGTEQALREAYLWRYVTVMLREMNERPALLASGYQSRYDAILAFTETHVYTKWRTRTGYTDIYPNRTHMVSHWAHICMNLAMIARSQTIRSECGDIVDQINNGMDRHGGAGLRSQLTGWSAVPGALHWANQWNQTPDSLGWPTDTNHGAAEVGYMAEAFDYGIDFTRAEIDGVLTLTNRHILPAGTSTPPAWISFDPGFCPSDYSDSVCSSYGNLFTDGFVKLGRFDSTLQKKLEIYIDRDPGLGQLAGNAALNAAVLRGTEP